MKNGNVSSVLEHRTTEEKKAILVELLRELLQHSPAHAVSIDDESGKSIGIFSPAGISLSDQAFTEGTPAFFAELERRRNSNERITADEALRQLRDIKTAATCGNTLSGPG